MSRTSANRARGGGKRSPARRVIRRKPVEAVGGVAQGRELIPALRDTGMAMLAWAVLSAVALAI